MTQVVIRPEAEADLAEIALFVGSTSRARADALIDRLLLRSRILATHPEAGRPRPELGRDIRCLVERPYLVFYRILGGTAEVIAFLHGARDLQSALAKRVEN